MTTNPDPGSDFRTPEAAGGLAKPEAMPPRRNWFYDVTAGLLAAVIGLVPAAIGLANFFDPWRRKPTTPRGRGGETGGPEGFTRVAALEALTVGGIPQRFPVISDQIDAWNFSPDQPVGAVFLQRVGDQDVRCFNATCPHAGCSVSCTGTAYVCPCHNSSFELDGDRRVAESGRENPSPRDLDRLEVDAEKLAAGEVWVKFQNFYTGKHEKIPKA